MQKTVSLQEDTYQDLDQARSTGQSFDGKIQELLENAGELPAEATAWVKNSNKH